MFCDDTPRVSKTQSKYLQYVIFEAMPTGESQALETELSDDGRVIGWSFPSAWFLVDITGCTGA